MRHPCHDSLCLVDGAHACHDDGCEQQRRPFQVQTGPVAAEYAKRLEAERSKAFAKYGADALLPSGHPDYDIMDFMANELVGLNRYCLMLEARCKEIEQLIDNRKIKALAREGVAIARHTFTLAGQKAFDLIELRQKLRAAGLHLGSTEGKEG